MRKLFRYQKLTKYEAVSRRQYLFMEDAVKTVAERLGWTPDEAQAAMWVSLKSQLEETAPAQAGVHFGHALEHHELVAEGASPDVLAAAEKRLNMPETSQIARNKIAGANRAQWLTDEARRFEHAEGLSSAVSDALEWATKEHTVHMQGERTAKGGLFSTDRGNVLYIFKEGDVSTFLHELGHIVQLHLPVEDQVLLAKHGLDDREVFARSWEAYFLRGKAPTPELKDTFEKLAVSMMGIYGHVSNIPLENMNKKVAAVFDRFLKRETNRNPAFGARLRGALAQEGTPDFPPVPPSDEAAQDIWSQARKLGFDPNDPHTKEGGRLLGAAAKAVDEIDNPALRDQVHSMLGEGDYTGAAKALRGHEDAQNAVLDLIGHGSKPTDRVRPYGDPSVRDYLPPPESSDINRPGAGIPGHMARGGKSLDARKLHDEVYGGEGAPHALMQEAPEPRKPILFTEAAHTHALEHNIDLAEVKGTGVDGRITKPDVESHRAQNMGAEERFHHGTRGSASVRGKQKKLNVETGSARSKEIDAILRDPNLSHEERRIAAGAAASGEYPKIYFKGFTRDLSWETLNEMKDMVSSSADLHGYQILNALDALDNFAAGKNATEYEMKLLTKVFGEDTSKSMEEILSWQQKLSKLGADFVNIPRTLEATFDVSAPLRQGLVALGRHPVISTKNMGKMMKAWRSEEYLTKRQAMLEARPNYDRYMQGGLDVTNPHEEQTQSDIAAQIFGRKYLRKIGGGPVRMSDRAFSMYLQETRADIFDHLLKVAQNDGRMTMRLKERPALDIDNPEFLKKLSKYINSTTGRGDIGNLGDSAKWINGMFFSPKLWKSRIDFMNPGWYYKLGIKDLEGPEAKFVRREAIRALIQSIGMVSTVLTLGGLAGAKVMRDPRSTDFGKMRLGNTRLDIAGGFQQEIRLFSQVVTGTKIDTTTGKHESLRSGKFGAPTALDQVFRFIQGKASPPAGVGLDLLRGTTFQGDPLTVKKEAYEKLMPLVLQDMRDIYHEHHGGMNGFEYALAGYPLAAMGTGVQTYPPKDVTKKSTQRLLDQAKEAGLDPPSAKVLTSEGVHAKITSAGRDAKDNRDRVDRYLKLYAEVVGRPYTHYRAPGTTNRQLEREAAHIAHYIVRDAPGTDELGLRHFNREYRHWKGKQTPDG